MFIPVVLERNYIYECLNGCICNIAGEKKMDSKSCRSSTEKTTDHFLVAPRHELLQYVLKKIALLANTLCVHKLYKVKCLDKIHLKQTVTFFY